MHIQVNTKKNDNDFFDVLPGHIPDYIAWIIHAKRIAKARHPLINKRHE
jgi:glycerol-3-phosphate responsive antiterminator